MLTARDYGLVLTGVVAGAGLAAAVLAYASDSEDAAGPKSAVRTRRVHTHTHTHCRLTSHMFPPGRRGAFL